MKIKDLLKVLLFTLIVGGIIIFFGCSNTKKTSVVISTEQVETLKPWQQNFRENIKISDKVFFYNDRSIEIKKSLYEEYNYVENGIIYSISSDKIADSIPVLTRFYSIEIIKQKGTNIINTMIVSSIKDSVEYILYFYREEILPSQYKTIDGKIIKIISGDPNKTFILSGNAAIKYKGNSSKINIDVSSIGKCYLLVDYRKIFESNKSIEEWEQYQFIP